MTCSGIGMFDDSVLKTLPEPMGQIQMIREHHQNGWTPMRRLGIPADVGNAVALFCSKEAGWITGQVVAVDGGMGLMDAAVPLAIAQPELRVTSRPGAVQATSTRSISMEHEPLQVAE